VYWDAVRLDVLTIERGAWPEPTLSFVVSSEGPTLELIKSGTIVDPRLWPYRTGVEWVFELDTSQRPALIVDQLEPGHGETAPASSRAAGK
jgi:hypothetical protein